MELDELFGETTSLPSEQHGLLSEKTDRIADYLNEETFEDADTMMQDANDLDHFTENDLSQPTEESYELPEQLILPRRNNFSLEKQENDPIFVRWPKYINTYHHPYEEATFPFEAWIQDDEDEQIAATRLSATLFWRQNKKSESELKDGESQDNETDSKEAIQPSSVSSNAHFVQWSDDSWSLVIGKEIFDLSFLPVEKQHKYLYVNTPFNMQESEINTKDASQGNPFRTTSNGIGTALTSVSEQVGFLSRSLSVKAPTALVKQNGRKWTQVAESRLKLTVTREDPLSKQRREENAMAERWKMEQTKKRHHKEQSALKKVYLKGLIDRAFLEDDEDEHSTSGRLTATKRKANQNRRQKHSDDEDEDESEDTDYDEDESELSNNSSTSDSDTDRNIQFSSAEESESEEKLPSLTGTASILTPTVSGKPARIVFSDDEDE